MGEEFAADYPINRDLSHLCEEGLKFSVDRFDGGLRVLNKRSELEFKTEEIYEGRFSKFPVFKTLKSEEIENGQTIKKYEIVPYIPESKLDVLESVDVRPGKALPALIATMYESSIPESLDNFFAEVVDKKGNIVEFTQAIPPHTAWEKNVSFAHLKEFWGGFSELREDNFTGFNEEEAMRFALSECIFSDDVKEDYETKEDLASLFTNHLANKALLFPSRNRALLLTSHFLQYADNLEFNQSEDINLETRQKSTLVFCNDLINYTAPLIQKFSDNDNHIIKNELHYARMQAFKKAYYASEGIAEPRNSLLDKGIHEYEQMNSQEGFSNDHVILYGELCLEKTNHSTSLNEQNHLLEESMRAYEKVITSEDFFDTPMVMYSYVASVKAFKNNNGFYTQRSMDMGERAKNVIDEFMIREGNNLDYLHGAKEDIDNPLDDDQREELEDDL